MRIREEQMEAFRNARIVEFTFRAVAHLRDLFSRETDHLSATELLNQTSRVVALAEELGIGIDSDVMRLVEYATYYGDDFWEPLESLDWLWKILRDEALDGTEKLDRIDAALRPTSN